jgi:hypothetical protein
MDEGAPHALALKRRELLVAAGGAVFLGACRLLSQTRGAETLIGKPHPESFRPVLRALLTTFLPFDHPSFPKVRVETLEAELLQLFPLEDDPELATIPKAMLLLDVCEDFDAPLAPFLDDQRLDLRARHLSDEAIDAAIERAVSSDRSALASYLAQHGDARFVEQNAAAREAYLRLWATSALVARRRIYGGLKAITTITAYSLPAFWSAVGYEGPVL